MDLTGIKSILLDLGGVILNIDYQLTIRAFQKLGISNFDALYSQAKQSQLFDQLEKGEISGSAFVEAIQTLSPKGLTSEEVISAWNSILLDLPEARFALLEKLKHRYPLYLLSNTNEIHVTAFMEQINKQFGAGCFEQLFEKVYFSNQIGLRKPDAASFEHVLKDSQLSAKETLFIDDSIANIEGAKKVGLQTHWLRAGERIEELFADYV